MHWATVDYATSWGVTDCRYHRVRRSVATVQQPTDDAEGKTSAECRKYRPECDYFLVR